MPRRNNTPKHTPYQLTNHEASKTRYATKREAEKAADYQMLMKPDLEIYVYQSDLDRGWYLTRKKPS